MSVKAWGWALTFSAVLWAIMIGIGYLVMTLVTKL